MANKENTSDEGLRVSYDVKTYHEQKIYRLYITAKGNIKKHYHRLRKIISEL